MPQRGGVGIEEDGRMYIMNDGKIQLNANPFTNEAMANDPIAHRIVMKVRARKGGSLALKIDKHYVDESANCEFHADNLKLNKWRVLMRWILKDHKWGDLSEWGWQFYKTVSVVRPGDLCAQGQHSESHLVIGAFDSEAEAKNLCAYLKTKLVIFLVAYKQVKKLIHKYPKRELTWNSFEYVPVQDFSKSWTDAELYKEYELEQDEIAFIESNLKPIKDDDCDVLSGDKEVSHV